MLGEFLEGGHALSPITHASVTPDSTPYFRRARRSEQELERERSCETTNYTICRQVGTSPGAVSDKTDN
ncbi:hypothetical protein J6590_083133 [Homalodisca vitripennis]|nr:hypothetical protein J6590_083133 [Homalodisca vitripennis]